MLGGDISNDSPSLVMVHVDVIAPWKAEEVRKMGGLLKSKKFVRKVNLRTANGLYRNSLTFRGISLECFSTSFSDAEGMERVEDYLDGKGLNPFRGFEVYPSVQAVVDQMAYLPRLLGVVDVPERGMRYGSKFMPSSRIVVPGFGG